MTFLKTILLGGFLLLFTSSAFAIENYSNGEYLYAWAISGLNMRDAPGLNAGKITKINYGDRVKVVDTEIRAYPFSYAMAKGDNATWVVDGHWVKVKFQNQVGYVFDAYLSKLPMMTNSPEEIPYFKLEMIKDYGKEHWDGLLEETKVETLNFDDNQRDPDKGLSSSYKLAFKNGAYYENNSEAFSGSTSLFIKDISLVEAYLIFNALVGYEYKKKTQEQGTSYPGSQLSSAKENQLRFTGEGMDSISIEKRDGGVLIEMSGGC